MKVDILVVDVPNKNGRIYSRETVQSMIDSAQSGRVLGVLGVPESIDLDLANVSHEVKNLRIEGDRLTGEIEVLETPMGMLLAETISEHGFRPRGIGVVDENGVVSDYTLISIDAVMDGA